MVLPWRLTQLQIRRRAGLALFSTNSSGPLPHYRRLVTEGKVKEDNHQLAALELLQSLHDELVSGNLYEPTAPLKSHPFDAQQQQSSWSSFFSSQPSPNLPSRPAARQISVSVPKSVYLWGGTGCGKTFMMDLFYAQLPIERKRRVHFNDFMIDVHKRLHKHKQREGSSRGDPGRARADAEHAISSIARDLLHDAIVLCFDEFQVTDIADAMILRSLFSSMFDSGAILVATSNRPPSDLYKNGLQRDLFLPFIQLLTDRSTVHSLSASKTDYRIVKHSLVAKSTYLSPLTLENRALFDNQLSLMQHEDEEGAYIIPAVAMELDVYGHILPVPSAIVGRRVARFEFKDLCEAALGAADFVDLAKAFRVVFISGVPKLSIMDRNSIRRLIILIDALYDETVQVIILAEESPLKLLQISPDDKAASSFDEVFAFDRTISRLLEMQSVSYFQAAVARRGLSPRDKLAKILKRVQHRITNELAETPLTILSLLEDSEVRDIYKDYNWGRDVATRPMPSQAYDVLERDIRATLRNLLPPHAGEKKIK